MSRKRKMFDIGAPDVSDDDVSVPTPETSKLRRRGPMAAAVRENREALQARMSTADLIREENDALAHEYVALRDAGQVVVSVPLDEIYTHLLTRDRLPGEDDEIDELVSSIREVGLSNPIRVIPRPSGGYELVQGYRRLTAYKRLRDEPEGQGAWDRVPALVLPEASDIGDLYRRMVDENVIRRELSFFEMARAAQNFAADPQTEAQDVGQAIKILFQSSARPKRTYIRHFSDLLNALGRDLSFPASIPRALGLSLSKRISEDQGVVLKIKDALASSVVETPEDELDILKSFVSKSSERGRAKLDKSKAPEKKETDPKRVTFTFEDQSGEIKCTADKGRLEIKIDRDFSTIDQTRLQEAIAAFLDAL